MQVLEFIVCLLPSPQYYTAETFGDSRVDSFEQPIVKLKKILDLSWNTRTCYSKIEISTYM